jgi:3-methyladenine DNA glycosylase AlkD
MPPAGPIARADLKRLARPARDFDAARYFRGAGTLGFYNVGTATVRRLARQVADAHEDWSVDDAVAFAELLLPDRYLEVKGLGVEVLARHRRALAPRHLAIFKRWLARNHSDNWATTDAICGALIGPLLLAHPPLVSRTRSWRRHRNMWVRRASIVSLIPLARRGVALDHIYAAAAALHGDAEDLIQKAVGWALREAGKADAARLERYLRRYGPRIPRTSVRYAIERFSPRLRAELLASTRGGRNGAAVV